MKNLILTNIISPLLFAAVILQSAFAFPSEGGFRMSGIELVNCNESKSKCLRVQSPDMVGSQLKSLQVFRSPSVLLIEGKKETKFVANTGYVDFAEGRVVFITRLKNGSAEELSFDLKTLRSRKVGIK